MSFDQFSLHPRLVQAVGDAGYTSPTPIQREALPPAGAEGEEPMFNALGRHDGKFWRLVVFPRRKHRPDIFHREEGERLLVTPGAFEMSGLVVVPRENDFFRIDKPRLLQILREVALPPRRTLGIAKRLLPDGEGR